MSNALHKLKYGHYAYFSDSTALNKKIIEGFHLYEGHSSVNKTHFFEGRYENIYIDREHIPELHQVIEQAISAVAEVLGIAANTLQCGFWFNSMQSGDVTQPHTHDDDDELMSAVYYVEVPENSGQLLLGVAKNQLIVEPEAGKLVMFKPNVVHEVTKNMSAHHRLSIGMNFGLKDEFKEDE